MIISAVALAYVFKPAITSLVAAIVVQGYHMGQKKLCKETQGFLAELRAQIDNIEAAVNELTNKKVRIGVTELNRALRLIASPEGGIDPTQVLSMAGQFSPLVVHSASPDSASPISTSASSSVSASPIFTSPSASPSSSPMSASPISSSLSPSSLSSGGRPDAKEMQDRVLSARMSVPEAVRSHLKRAQRKVESALHAEKLDMSLRLIAFEVSILCQMILSPSKEATMESIAAQLAQLHTHRSMQDMFSHLCGGVRPCSVSLALGRRLAVLHYFLRVELGLGAHRDRNVHVIKCNNSNKNLAPALTLGPVEVDPLTMQVQIISAGRRTINAAAAAVVAPFAFAGAMAGAALWTVVAPVTAMVKRSSSELVRGGTSTVWLPVRTVADVGQTIYDQGGRVEPLWEPELAKVVSKIEQCDPTAETDDTSESKSAGD